MKRRQARKILARQEERMYRGSTLARAYTACRDDWLYGLSPLTGVGEAFAEMARYAQKASLALWQLSAIPLKMLNPDYTNYGTARQPHGFPSPPTTTEGTP
jgi:hypothetical protein